MAETLNGADLSLFAESFLPKDQALRAKRVQSIRLTIEEMIGKGVANKFGQDVVFGAAVLLERARTQARPRFFFDPQPTTSKINDFLKAEVEKGIAQFAPWLSENFLEEKRSLIRRKPKSIRSEKEYREVLDAVYKKFAVIEDYHRETSELRDEIFTVVNNYHSEVLKSLEREEIKDVAEAFDVLNQREDDIEDFRTVVLTSAIHSGGIGLWTGYKLSKMLHWRGVESGDDDGPPQSSKSAELAYFTEDTLLKLGFKGGERRYSDQVFKDVDENQYCLRRAYGQFGHARAPRFVLMRKVLS